jgi:hypothetical protein
MSAVANRIRETSTTTGTGNFTLAGAVTGYRTFNTGFGLNLTFEYTIEAVDAVTGVPTGDWEVGQGHLTNSTTLSRDVILDSSNSGSIVSFSSGSKSVFCSPSSNAFLQTVLTADTNIAAGSGVSINSSGHAVQTWGPSRVFSSSVAASAFTGNPTIIPLDATHFLLLQAGTRVQAGSISGGVISLGTADTTAPSLALTLTNCCVLDSSNFALIYNGPTNATVVIGSVDGSNNITYGTPQQITASPLSGSAYVQTLSSTSFVAMYRIGTAGLVIAGTVSGTTITLGSSQQLTTNITSMSAQTFTLTNGLCTLSSSLFATIYGDAANSNKVTLCAGTVSGTTITLGTPQVFATLTGNGVILPISSTTVFTVRDIFSTRQSAVCTISGTVFTIGGDGTFGGAAILVIRPFGSNVIGVFSGSTPIIASISGTTFTTSGTKRLGQLLTPAGGAKGTIVSSSFSIAVLSSSLFLVFDNLNQVYRCDGSANPSPSVAYYYLNSFNIAPLDGATAIATIQDAGGASPVTVELIKANSANLGPIGLTAAGATAGQQVTVVQSGVVTGFSGLTPGARYYHNGDGTLITQDTGILAGIALSATTMLAMPTNNTKV